MSDAADWLPARYTLEQRVGSGGMGEVWTALDRDSHRRVAIKRLRVPDDAPAEEAASARLRFHREFLTLRRLDIPGVVRAHDYGERDGACYYAMDYIEGRTLRLQLLERDDRLERLWRLAAELLEILARLHAEGVLHRDLKPANLIVTDEDRLHLIDFGLARESAESAAITRVGEVLGTPSYLAPEQIQGAALDGRTDLYAVGVILYEIACGELPFKGGITEVLLAHLQRAPVAPRLLNPAISPGHNAFILRLLAKEPAARPASARAALEALCEAGADDPSGATAEISDAVAALPAPAGLLVAPYCGNRDVRDRLLEACDRLAGGAGAGALVSGAPGAGKSRLADEVRARARERGLVFLRGAAVADGGLAGHCFHDLFARVADHLLPRPSVARRWLGDEGAVLAAAFPALRRIPGVVPAELPDKPALLASLFGFFSRACLDRLVIWIDDLHWADPLSLDLIAHLAANFTGAAGGPQGLVILTSREEALAGDEPAARMVARAGAERLPRLRLAPLTADELGELAGALTGIPAAPDPAFLARLHELSGGNPFLATGLLRDLRARGLLAGGAGVWRAALAALPGDPSAPGGLGGEARDAVERQLAGLVAEDRARLAVAALLGTRFGFALWQIAADGGEDALLETAERALRAGLLREAGRDELVFSHDLLRAGLVAPLSDLRRRRIHGRIVAALLAAPGSAGTDEALAHHAIEAGDARLAARHGHPAAQRLRRLGQPAAEQRLLERIEALFAAGEPMPPEVRMRHRLLECALHIQQGRHAVALEKHAEAARIAGERGDRRAELESWMLAVNALTQLGDAAGQRDAVERVRALAGTLGDVAAQLDAERWLGRALLGRGELARAAEVLEPALEKARAAGDPRPLAALANTLALLRLAQGDLDGFGARTREALAANEACGDRVNLTVNTGNLGEYLVARGELGEAEARLADALAMSRAMNFQGYLPDLLNTLGLLAVLRRRDEDAERCLVESVALASMQSAREYEAEGRLLRARLRALQGRVGDAEAETVRAEALADACDRPALRARALAARAAVALAGGDADSARGLAARALSLAPPDATIERARALAIGAAAGARAGAGLDAAAFAEAEALAQRAGHLDLQLTVHVLRARALVDAGAPAAGARLAGEVAVRAAASGMEALRRDAAALAR